MQHQSTRVLITEGADQVLFRAPPSCSISKDQQDQQGAILKTQQSLETPAAVETTPREPPVNHPHVIANEAAVVNGHNQGGSGIGSFCQQAATSA
jgi:hypothetical protein